MIEMISWDSPVVIGIIGFIGGILGGVIVNIISIKYQKREERIVEEEKTKRVFFEQIKSILNEIIEIWDKEKTRDHIDRQRIKNDFNNYSRQLTSLIASAPTDFPLDKLSQLRELSSSLNKIDDITIGISPDLVQRFYDQIDETVDLTKKIRNSFSQF